MIDQKVRIGKKFNFFRIGLSERKIETRMRFFLLVFFIFTIFLIQRKIIYRLPLTNRVDDQQIPSRPSANDNDRLTGNRHFGKQDYRMRGIDIQ